MTESEPLADRTRILKQRSPRIKNVGLGLAVVVIAGSIFAQEKPREVPRSRFSSADEQQLRAVTARIREAILTENIAVLLQSISAVLGLQCTDTTYSHEQIKTFLQNRNSHLYISLFDSARFARQCGRSGYPPEYPAISEKEFLRSANSAVEIVRIDNDWAKVTLISPVPSQFPRVWNLHREAGTWEIAGVGFVIGNCSCG